MVVGLPGFSYRGSYFKSRGGWRTCWRHQKHTLSCYLGSMLVYFLKPSLFHAHNFPQNGTNVYPICILAYRLNLPVTLYQDSLVSKPLFATWGSTWRIIPVGKWLVSMVSKSPKQGCSPSKWPKWLINVGYYLLTNSDDPPSRSKELSDFRRFNKDCREFEPCWVDVRLF